jgi:CheY-like chemotaxis protein
LKIPAQDLLPCRASLEHHASTWFGVAAAHCLSCSICNIVHTSAWGCQGAKEVTHMLNDVTILLAEDDENDIFLMGRAFARAAIPNPLQVVHNGQEAIDYLSGVGQFTQRSTFPLPGLMLLDLKMPWMDGFDVLKWLRERAQFDGLPVVVLTSSKLQSDVDRSRQFGVHDYRVKPHGFDDLVKLLDDVRQCWLDERFNRFALAQSSSIQKTA